MPFSYLRAPDTVLCFSDFQSGYPLAITFNKNPLPNQCRLITAHRVKSQCLNILTTGTEIILNTKSHQTQNPFL